MADDASQRDCPYLYAHVLLLSWEGCARGFNDELDRIERVFHDDYNFTTEKWKIPKTDYIGSLTETILKFVKKDGPDTLLVLYYGGHGYTNTDRHLLWSLYSDKQPAVDWSGLRQLFSQKQSDVLMILDCCAAGSAVGERHEGMVELLLACGSDMTTPLSGRSSFTRKVADKLKDCFQDGIEAYDIYHCLSQDYNISGPQKQRSQPIHVFQGRQTRTAFLRRMPSFYSIRSRLSSQKSTECETRSLGSTTSIVGATRSIRTLTLQAHRGSNETIGTRTFHSALEQQDRRTNARKYNPEKPRAYPPSAYQRRIKREPRWPNDASEVDRNGRSTLGTIDEGNIYSLQGRSRRPQVPTYDGDVLQIQIRIPCSRTPRELQGHGRESVVARERREEVYVQVRRRRSL